MRCVSLQGTLPAVSLTALPASSRCCLAPRVALCNPCAEGSSFGIWGHLAHAQLSHCSHQDSPQCSRTSWRTFLFPSSSPFHSFSFFPFPQLLHVSVVLSSTSPVFGVILVLPLAAAGVGLLAVVQLGLEINPATLPAQTSVIYPSLRHFMLVFQIPAPRICTKL